MIYVIETTFKMSFPILSKFLFNAEFSVSLKLLAGVSMI